MVAPVPISPEMNTASVAPKHDVLGDNVSTKVQAGHDNTHGYQATSCPLTPIESEPHRSSSTFPEDTGTGNECGRSKTAEPEKIVEWSPSQRYGKVYAMYLMISSMPSLEKVLIKSFGRPLIETKELK